MVLATNLQIVKYLKCIVYCTSQAIPAPPVPASANSSWCPVVCAQYAGLVITFDVSKTFDCEALINASFTAGLDHLQKSVCFSFLI